MRVRARARSIQRKGYSVAAIAGGRYEEAVAVGSEQGKMTYANERAPINSHLSGTRACGRHRSEGQQTTTTTTTAGRDGGKSTPFFLLLLLTG